MMKPPRRYAMPDPTEQVLTDEAITAHIEPGSRVIDLGCGDGRLLERLRRTHNCLVQGVEVDPRRILRCVERGVPVVQADLDTGLEHIPDRSFDCAVLSQTLQQVRRPREVLQDIFRIARRALVVVPNFAHWRVRWEMVTRGRAPVTASLPYEWYDTPNLHVMSLHDFRELCDIIRVRVVKELPIVRGRAVERAWLASLRAHSGLYVLERIDNAIDNATDSEHSD